MRMDAHKAIGWMTVCGLAFALGASGCSGQPDDGSVQEPDTTAGAASVTPGVEAAAPRLTRLTNREYDSAIQDLLGVRGLAETTFPADGATVTDTVLTGEQFQRYFDAADALGEQVFTEPSLTSRLLTCTPAAQPAGQEDACTRLIVANFGTKAWRMPIEPAELDRLTGLATDAVALGETPRDSIKQVVKTVLASPQFLYRVDATSL